MRYDEEAHVSDAVLEKHKVVSKFG